MLLSSNVSDQVGGPCARNSYIKLNVHVRICILIPGLMWSDLFPVQFIFTYSESDRSTFVLRFYIYILIV